MLGATRRLAILAEGQFTRLDAKTAVGVLRYRGAEVCAILDSTRAGRTAEACVGVGGGVPVVATLDEAAARGADALMIGIAPIGGTLPAAWRAVVTGALERGWDVLSGLHAFLADDPEFAALARAHGATLHDVRRPPRPLAVAMGRTATLAPYVLLTVGTDCNVGKMTTALQLEAALRARGARAVFVATGQTGIFIADRGVAVDAVPADFAAGAIERCVLDAAADADVVLVEGQGALHHPGFSGVTLSLLHGACPAGLILCHEVQRGAIRRSGDLGDAIGVRPLAEVCEAYERAARWVRPAPVIGIALQTADLDEAAARAAVAAASRETGLPATDPVRFDIAPLAAAAEAAMKAHAATRAAGRTHAATA